MRRTGGDALAVYAADKVSRVRELHYMLAEDLTREQAEGKLGRHREALAMLEVEIPDNRLVEILRFELESLDALPPRAGG